MRVVAAIGLGVFALGAALTWATDWVVLGAIVMVAGAAGLFVLVMVSASRDRGTDAHFEATGEPRERMSAGWPRR